MSTEKLSPEILKDLIFRFISKALNNSIPSIFQVLKYLFLHICLMNLF